MEILNEITKEVFEANVPAAKMPERNTSVYGRMQESISVAYKELVQEVIGEGYVNLIDTDAALKGECIREVCLNAFIRTCRSLDLVLTATGFGVVSTESTAPASKSRVDALIEEMGVKRLLARNEIVRRMTRAEGWGTSAQAKNCIPTLFWSPMQLEKYTTMSLTTENWQKAKGRATTASEMLSDEISMEYMEELLVKLRKNDMDNADIIVMYKGVRFMAEYISHDEMTLACKAMLRNIVEVMETYKESYPTYMQSRLYARRHAEKYQNRKEDPTFFFM